jgi:hypothetical protein
MVTINPILMLSFLPLLASNFDGLMCGNSSDELRREIMANPRKCANVVCTCTPQGNEKYCSPHCEKIAGRLEVVCMCAHDDCGSNVKEDKTITEHVHVL